MKIAEARKLVEEAYEKRAARTTGDVAKRSLLYGLGGAGLGAGLGLLGSEFVGDAHESDPELAKEKRKRRRLGALLGGLSVGGLGGLGAASLDAIATSAVPKRKSLLESMGGPTALGVLGTTAALGSAFGPQLAQRGGGAFDKLFRQGGVSRKDVMQKWTDDVARIKQENVVGEQKHKEQLARGADPNLLGDFTPTDLPAQPTFTEMTPRGIWDNIRAGAKGEGDISFRRLGGSAAGAGLAALAGTIGYNRTKSGEEEKTAAGFLPAAWAGLKGIGGMVGNHLLQQTKQNPVEMAGLAATAGAAMMPAFRNFGYRNKMRKIHSMTPDHIHMGGGGRFQPASSTPSMGWGGASYF